MSEADASAVNGRGWIWPVVIVALLSLNVLVVAITVIAATMDPSVAVEPDYYQKALSWDEGREQRRDPADDGLGVTVRLLPASDRLSKGRVTVAISRLDEPVQDAHLEAEIFHHARSGDRQKLVLEASEPGVYVADAVLRREGIWEVRLLLVTGETTYQFARVVEFYGD